MNVFVVTILHYTHPETKNTFMKAKQLIIILAMAAILFPVVLQAQKEKDHAVEKANWRVDNNGYWKSMAEKGLSTLNPMVSVPQATYTGSRIYALSSVTEDSPDIPVTTENSTQSENSIFINPADPQNVLNSNNSTANPYPPLYGANDFYSFDGGQTWDGELQGAGTDNSGDPAVVIGNNGWYYVNSITGGGSYGQQVAYSTDQGNTWNTVIIDNGVSAYVLDKNHFWIDNHLLSPYEGNLYCAWTDFGGPHNYDIALSYSSDQGLSWSNAQNISAAVNAGSHCQGVNINTGPNGEVYAVFAIYDGSSDENAHGMAKSLDGGANWQPATRIIENIRGIRFSETSKNMRVNSFPVLAVDVSGGAYHGNLYVVWANIGIPGVNTGSDIDVYMIRSEDQGDTWSSPIRVNQDEAGLGHQHYFPWITCDPITGTLSVVFYDDRNVGGNQCEVFCANSFDGGETWEDFKVSDVSFTPTPIPGLAMGYMGDYLGISARDSYVYPCWTDNRTGTSMTYVSPYVTNNLSRPFDLTAVLDEETGSVELEWQYEPAPGFINFILYRENVIIAQPVDQNFTDQLPDYGIYQYKVTAYYEPDGESTPAAKSLQWGNPHILVSPGQLTQVLQPDHTAVKYLNITNTGELELHYNISTFILTDGRDNRDYCAASGGCDEFIAIVEFGDIYNSSSCGGYQDFTDLSTSISLGETIPITVTNGNTWDGDVCGIWIDWNQNQDFSDDEPIIVSGGPGVFTAGITPPDNAVGGTTRMRIRIQYYGTPDPCGTTTYGEVEDYSVNVVTWLTVDPKAGSLMPGNSLQAEVTFDATGMDLGEYQAEFQVSSNDPDLPQFTVPVTMLVSEFGVTAAASPPEICLGESTQLQAAVFGGLGSYVYSWTSDPPGFTSTLQNPYVIPQENTSYFISVTDGTNSANGQVDVTVYDLPVVSLGADTTICQGTTTVFDAGEGFTSYLWQDGSNGQSIIAGEAGTYWVEVSNEYGCKSSDTLILSVYPLAPQPAKPAGPGLVDLYNGNISEYATGNYNNVLYYEWLLDPAEAGIMENNGREMTIAWDTTYTGNASLKVMIANICGESPWSDSLDIMIVNTTGQNENELSFRVSVYPNPSQGIFTLEINTDREFTANIYLASQLGVLLQQSQNIIIHKHYSQTFNLSQLSKGVYTIIIESDKGRLSKQIIIHDQPH
jgi:hypothetical protein